MRGGYSLLREHAESALKLQRVPARVASVGVGTHVSGLLSRGSGVVTGCW